MTTLASGIADLALRPATLDDAEFVADMYTELFPDDPEDPQLIRHYWEHPWEKGSVERYLVLRDGRPAGLVGMSHVPWEDMPERYARAQGELAHAVRTPERLAALFAFAEERAAADGARRVTAWAWEHDRPRIDALLSRGFREERRERFWELDLVSNREKLEEMTRASRQRMRDQGIRVLTVAESQDLDVRRKIWAMSEEASLDVPTTVPHVATPYEVFEQFFLNPGIREDRMWIARVGDDVVGVSVLNYPPVRGVVVTDWTGTARSVRGKGVARALKCETVIQAIGLGVDRVRTDNDSENAPILHINDTMGYKPRAPQIQFIKDLLGGG
ncbi:MAG: GNAT family N-acetyltransferase [Candidatus Limnocylindria bacterium]